MKNDSQDVWEGRGERGRHFREHLGLIGKLHARSRRDVEFKNGAGVAGAGIFGGALFGLGGTWIILAQGAVLGPKVQTTLVILSLALGGTAVLASAFFGLVIPHHVHHGPIDGKGCCDDEE